RSQVDDLSDRILERIAAHSRLPGEGDDTPLEPGWLKAVTTSILREFDDVLGGFAGAPKFPPHASLAVLLAHAHRAGDRKSLEAATHSLDQMALGGMYDLLGGGFARYSVDEEWRIPHFEKMLYDNAQLVPVYLDAWKCTGHSRYARIVRETLDYLLREMQIPEGGFCASQDADSEGEEGKFFVWTPAELRQHLGERDGERAAGLLEVTPTGTFEHGTSVLRLDPPIENRPAADVEILERAMRTLLQVRSRRIPPARDDKIITAWNGLAISAFSRAGATLGELCDCFREAIAYTLPSYQRGAAE
ncbi:MAG: N-acylglucosamine 2-epimerase, partial [Myxococcota bacterium]|nr:N-acylglucosamine 2-epimerase [Myxococcota bacterium]